MKRFSTLQATKKIYSGRPKKHISSPPPYIWKDPEFGRPPPPLESTHQQTDQQQPQQKQH